MPGSSNRTTTLKRKLSGSVNRTNASPKHPSMMALPAWYKINEISPKDFVKCCKDIYRVVEQQHKSKSTEDPFLKAVVVGHNKLTEEAWKRTEAVRLDQKALEGKMGDFHEELMGKFSGFETYPVGHSTGCDVGSIDGKIVMEVKNRDNTMNSSSGEAVIGKLSKNQAAGRRAILVEVNCPNGKVNRYGAPATIEVWNGQKTYEFLSGRESFFRDLQSTLEHVFREFKTQEELKRALGIA